MIDRSGWYYDPPLNIWVRADLEEDIYFVSYHAHQERPSGPFWISRTYYTHNKRITEREGLVPVLEQGDTTPIERMRPGL